jgi:hypothetical protein
MHVIFFLTNAIEMTIKYMQKSVNYTINLRKVKFGIFFGAINLLINDISHMLLLPYKEKINLAKMGKEVHGFILYTHLVKIFSKCVV